MLISMGKLAQSAEVLKGLKPQLHTLHKNPTTLLQMRTSTKPPLLSASSHSTSKFLIASFKLLHLRLRAPQTHFVVLELSRIWLASFHSPSSTPTPNPSKFDNFFHTVSGIVRDNNACVNH